MIVLDTNVISELMRATPDPLVLAWVAAQPRVDLLTTRINHADIVEPRRAAGRTVDGNDALIGAIALAAGATVATRDFGGFDACGLDLINPWTSG